MNLILTGLNVGITIYDNPVYWLAAAAFKRRWCYRRADIKDDLDSAMACALGLDWRGEPLPA